MAPAAAQFDTDLLPQLPAEGSAPPLPAALDDAPTAADPGPAADAGTLRLEDMEPAAPATMADCARALLRTRLASTVSGEDLLAALAVETELLILCRERQELVAAILAAELELAALQDAADPVTTEDPAAEAPDDLLDQLGLPAAAPAVATTTLAAEPVAAAAPAAAPPPDLGWFSIMGSAGDLRAGLTDGLEAWWVRTGSLVRGMRVSRIGTHPPGVEVEAGGTTHTLPHRERWREGDG